MRQHTIRLLASLTLGLGAIGFVGCDDQDTNPPPANPGAGPAERAGEAIDRNAENAGEKIQRGVDRTEDALDRAGDRIKDGVDRAADNLRDPATRPATQPVDR